LSKHHIFALKDNCRQLTRSMTSDCTSS